MPQKPEVYLTKYNLSKSQKIGIPQRAQGWKQIAGVEHQWKCTGRGRKCEFYSVWLPNPCCTGLFHRYCERDGFKEGFRRE